MAKKKQEPKLLTVREVAEMFDTSEQTVRRRARLYGVQTDRVVGRVHLYSPDNPKFGKLAPQERWPKGGAK